MNAKRNNPITALDLTEGLERPLIKLPDGNLYEMRLIGEFSLKKRAVFGRVGTLLDKVSKGSGDLTPQEDRALTQSSIQMIDMLLPDAPDDVREKLTDEHRGRIIDLFFDLALKEKAPISQNGSPQSLDSADSTAVPLTSG